MTFRAPHTTLVLALAILAAAASARADSLYWTDTLGYDSILQFDLDNDTGAPPVAKFYTPLSPSAPQGFAIDAVSQYFYWSSNTTIGRIAMDGSSVNNTFINRGTSKVFDIDVYNAGTGGKLYWTEKSGSNAPYIMRSDLDGSNVETFWQSSTWSKYESPFGLEVDSTNGWVYWTSRSNSVPGIYRTSFDKATTELLVNCKNDPTWQDAMPLTVIVDTQENMMYWTEWGDTGSYGRIMKMSLEGTLDSKTARGTVVYDPGDANAKSLGIFTPYGLTLDPESGTLYFTVTDQILDSAQNSLYKIQTDGTGLAPVIVDPKMDFPAFIEFYGASGGTTVPEPSAMVLLAGVLAGWGFWWWRKKR